MNEWLEPIIKSPKFPELARTLHDAWEAEQRRRNEFVDWLTPEMKAEFISGEIVMHSPARARHLQVTRDLLIDLGLHIREAAEGVVFSEKCLISLTRNDYEPDIVYFGPDKAAEIDSQQMRFPAPDFVIEVLSESTEAIDRGVKFRDYAAHGVREYWIVDTAARTVEQYVLPDGTDSYELHEKLGHGTVQSVVIVGFELALDRIFTA